VVRRVIGTTRSYACATQAALTRLGSNVMRTSRVVLRVCARRATTASLLPWRRVLQGLPRLEGCPQKPVPIAGAQLCPWNARRELYQKVGNFVGSVLSPLLANVALDGMERLFEAEGPDGRPKAPSHRKGTNKGVSVIRYADDFVITAPTREVLETYARPRMGKFLKQRGLALNEGKTRIIHIREGLNFLGFHIRKFGSREEKLLTVPQKEKVLKHVRAIRSYLDAHKQTPAGKVIKELNPVIRGWANYYRHSVAKDVFSKVRHVQWRMLWIWAKRRHPNKSSTWVKARYFRNDGYWTFWEGKTELVKPDATPITRFTKVIGRNSPYDPALRQYWTERKKQQVGRETFAKERLMLHQRQGYRCALCTIPFVPGEDIETDHIVLTSQGGTDDINNKRLVHPWCHRQRHQKDGRQRLRA